MLYRAFLIGGRFGYHLDPFGAALNSGAPITALVHLQDDRAEDQRVIIVCGDQILAENAAADPSTADDITGGLTVTSGADNFCDDANFKGSQYFCNGVDVPFKVGATGNAAAIPNWYVDNRAPRCVFQKWGFLFFAGYKPTSPSSTLNPMTVNYGELQDDTTWTDNILDTVGGLSPYGDEYVTCLFEHRDFLMVGTNRRIYPISYTGISTRRFLVQRPLNVGVGGARSVVSLNGEYTFFMDSEGQIHTIRDVAEGFGDVGIQTISAKISNRVANLNSSRIQYTQGAYWKERGFVCFLVSAGITQSTHNEIWVLDINEFPLDSPDHRAAKWFPWTDITSANVLRIMQRDSASVSSASEPSVTGDEFLYFGSTTGWVKRFSEEISYDEADDATQNPIQTEFGTKFYDFGHPDVQKSIPECLWTMEPASEDQGPTARINYDFGAYFSNSAEIDMNANLAGGDLLGSTFILGTSRLAQGTQATQSRDGFFGAGLFASLELDHQLQGTVAWKMQRATPSVELRGIPQEVR